MIIWKGAGFIVAVVAFLMLLLTELSVETLFNDDRYYQRQGWPKLLAFFVAGCIVLLIEWFSSIAGAARQNCFFG